MFFEAAHSPLRDHYTTQTGAYAEALSPL